ncbi:MAG: redoxin domain-containing protein [Chloroflexi bacterium]|nr:redoxin domain-containing protein [Chloroflexota bacterium]
MRDDREKFETLDVQILGVNPGTLSSHERFARKHGFNFPLLVDEDRSVAKAYGAAGLLRGIQRTVVIVDKEGVVRYVKKGMPKDEELLKVVKDLQAS